MERLIYEKLKRWKTDPDRKPLVIEGARQVGKTWILKAFGKAEFRNLVYLNCDNNPLLDGLFRDFDMARVLRYLSAISNERITPGETLIVLDEIQELDRGLPALKYFCEDAGACHVAVAGSLLGMSLHLGTGYPVGRVDELKMHPLSFREFLLACGRRELVAGMAAHDWGELSAMRAALIELLRQYCFTGGMPEAVDCYVRTQDIRRVRRIQETILSSYRRDFSKHAPAAEVPRINMVWDAIPSQLARENKKFVYGALKAGGRAKEYEKAIGWLMDAGLIHRVNRVNRMGNPLKAYEDLGAFKLYVADVGLLGAMAGAAPADMLTGDNGFVEFKGSLTEQYVVQQFVAAADTPPCYYKNPNSTLEIDLAVQSGTSGAVYAVEVKAEENLRAKSLATILRNNPEVWGIRFSMADYRRQERMENIPLYLAEEWFRSIVE